MDPKIKSSKKRSILIVEDEQIIADMYVRVFEMRPFKAFVARNYEEGLALFEKVFPSFVLLDLLLPQQGAIEADYAGEPVGLTLLRKIRQHPEGQDTTVIVLTNLAQDLHKKQAMNLGADLYLVKAEIEPVQLVKRVDSLAR
ncbi:MAG: response regulator [Patescibacteria group bacterium]